MGVSPQNHFSFLKTANDDFMHNFYYHRIRELLDVPERQNYPISQCVSSEMLTTQKWLIYCDYR